jgi:predicted nuclease of restriction endonuclease-like RecB superfamily
MLTKAQRVYHWDRHSSSISSDRLEEDCLPLLARAIAVYRGGAGRRRGEVRNAARAALEGLRPDRVEAVIKLLDDAAIYEWPPGSRQAERRLRVFEAAAARHPLLDREAAGALLGAAFDPPPRGHDEAVALLYADYPEFHRLAAFPPDCSPAALRADYDLAQAQALLYDATVVEVEASQDLRHVVQYARLSRLMHRIARGPRGAYRLVLDGPTSVLRRTHAYGVDFARFVAALVQARDWRMRAEIVLRAGWRPFVFTLSAADGLRSRVPAPRLFDSSLEEGLARKFGAARAGWRLRREAMLLEAGERLVVPDFVFTHEDGTEVALEIVGYWTPEYLAAKLEKLGRVRGVNLIVAVRRSLALRAGALPPGALLFKSRLLLKDLMPRLEAFRGPRAARGGVSRRAPRAGDRQAG